MRMSADRFLDPPLLLSGSGTPGLGPRHHPRKLVGWQGNRSNYREFGV